MINAKFKDLYITSGENPYKECIQGIANEPICVHALLVEAEKFLKSEGEEVKLTNISLDEIINRLVANRPRVAIIGGSTDHPAHLRDKSHIYRAALRIWYNGGVPFNFNLPIICDGTAQNNIGQSYSLASRNHTAAAVNITMEGHSYHAAWVIAGCDKSPAGILSGLAAADRARMRESRKFGALWACFAPSHVLKGGEIPQDICKKLEAIAYKATKAGHADLAHDIEENMRYILQCSSDEAFWGQIRRAQALELITEAEGRDIMNKLAAATCDEAGGICAFNGTGNSSRTLLQSFGLVPKKLELLCAEATTAQINEAMDLFFASFNNKELRVVNILKNNFANSIKIHSTTGSSTNMLLHIPAIMRYAGFDISIHDYVRIRKANAIPEIFAHSLTDDRDTFVLAQQFKKHQHHGVESLYKVLHDLDIELDLNAPTIMGKTWAERLATIDVAVDPTLKEQAVIRTTPIREQSGVEILSGNFCSSAAIKISGMSDKQYAHFNRRYFITRFYENEHVCNQEIMSPNLVERLVEKANLSEARLKYLCKANNINVNNLDAKELLSQGLLSFCLVIAGQGPKAYGMPEMFSPSQNLRHHNILEKSSILLTDGRYSGVTKGACIGHATPEAFEGGAIGALMDGDILYLDFDKQQILYVDDKAFDLGQIVFPEQLPLSERQEIMQQRMNAMVERRFDIAASNLMAGTTHAEEGVVPIEVSQRAIEKI